MRKVIIERHSYKTKQVLDSPRGPIDVEIETLTIMTTMVGDDEVVDYGPFEEELLVPPVAPASSSFREPAPWRVFANSAAGLH